MQWFSDLIAFILDGENYEWIFSGIGVFSLSVIGAIFMLFIKLRRNSSVSPTVMIQKNGSNSTNYQSHGDMNFGMEKPNDK